MSAAVDDALRSIIRETLREVVREELLPELRRVREPAPAPAPRSSAKLTTGRAAKLAGVTAETIRAWVDAGRFPAMRDQKSRRLVIDREVFERFLVEREGEAIAPVVDLKARARQIIGRL